MSTPPSAKFSPPHVAQEQPTRRRSFSAAYKEAILRECDAATQPGQIGEILRREGLYSSHLTDWRRIRAERGLLGLQPKKTGRPPRSPMDRANDKELERLRRENDALKEKLRRGQIIVEAQKKLATLLAPLEPQTEESSG